MRKNCLPLLFVILLLFSFSACTTRSSGENIQNLESRLTKLEEKVSSQEEKQQSINDWTAKRLGALEAQNPNVAVPPPPILTQKQTAGPASIQAPNPALTPAPPLVSASTPSPKGTTSAAPSNAPQAATPAEASPPPAANTQPTTHPPAPAPIVQIQNQAAPAATITPPTQTQSGQAQINSPAPKSAAPKNISANTSPSGSPTPAPAPASPATTKAAGSSDKAAYAAALSLLEKGKTEQGLAGMDKFLTEFPQSPLAPNALYWKGEALYTQLKFDDAILAFKDVVTKYTKSNKAADALLKIGMSYQHLSDTDNAKFYFQMLLEDYPDTRSAALAKKRLAAIK